MWPNVSWIIPNSQREVHKLCQITFTPSWFQRRPARLSVNSNCMRLINNTDIRHIQAEFGILKETSQLHFLIFLVLVATGLALLFACHFLQSWFVCKWDRKDKEKSKKLNIFRENRPLVKEVNNNQVLPPLPPPPSTNRSQYQQLALN